MPTAILIKRCLAKDKHAWQIFLRKYSRLIYWAINNRLNKINAEHSQNDIEDIFQNVFLTLFEENKLLLLKNIKFLPGWLAILASNKTVDYMRKKFRNRENLGAILPGFNTDYKKELLNKELLTLTSEIIDSLPNREKLIISLNILEEKTHKEIAEITAMPINTISTIISRTKEKIRKELKKLKENDN